MTATPKSASEEAQAFADELKLAALGWHHSTVERDLMDRALLTIWNLQRALAAQTPVAVEGWKLVPVEQLRDWYTAAWVTWLETIADGEDEKGQPTPPHLREMDRLLSASPTPPTASVAESVTVRTSADRDDA